MNDPSTPSGVAAATLSVTSPSFGDGRPIPAEHATPEAGGANVSPALNWSGAPKTTRSFAIECVDLAPVASNWVHWLVVDIPASASGVSAGASGSSMPAGARELRNSYGRPGWGGPQPPKGSGTHDYRFIVYALDVAQVPVSDSVSLPEFREALDGHVVGRGEITGTYRR